MKLPTNSKKSDHPTSETLPRGGRAHGDRHLSEESEVLSPLDVHRGHRGLGALEPAPAKGKIRLETSHMSYRELLVHLQQTSQGMERTPAYSTLPILGDLSAAADGFGDLLGTLAASEVALKELRLKVAQWAQTYAGVLSSAALACANADSTPATLVSGGWKLRRQPGPPQPMRAPRGLRLLQTAHPGEGEAKWDKEPNARYYDLQVEPVEGALATIAAPVIVNSTRTRCPLPLVTPGSQVQISVRAVGAKGPGPFCDPLIVRVS